MGMEETTEMVLVQELFEQGLSKSAMARRLNRDREAIRLWLRSLHYTMSDALWLVCPITFGWI